MSIMSQLLAASRHARPSKHKGTPWEDEKKAVRSILTTLPSNRKHIILKSGLSAEKVDKALKELVATGVAKIVRPGEFGRRSLYVLSDKYGENSG